MEGEFERVKESVLHVLNVHESQIEHIGSTSIEGIKAKPIIDILLGVENLDGINRDFEKALHSIGFYRLRVEGKMKLFLRNLLTKDLKMKTHFIHAVTFNGNDGKPYFFLETI